MFWQKETAHYFLHDETADWWRLPANMIDIDACNGLSAIYLDFECDMSCMYTLKN